ncbi:sulfur carrier protein [Sedimentibacter acidaminivorans]|uniref:Sulfur carrier protein n=1 Tax=Sedimentibacter acidaminivorans TaxID=913099 RepID=A0ABS4GD82_9FIRM|nr:sulfur carrier protein ThiS [Sedimentibacter acidaminivorans]MBP1925658.1 sulfur carrier protein [Sedimentibacter acidaminivorans]
MNQVEVIQIIKLNGRDFPWEAGMTVEDIMNKKNFIFPKIIVKINNQHIEVEDYPTTIVNDGDNVQMIHLLAGG